MRFIIIMSGLLVAQMSYGQVEKCDFNNKRLNSLTIECELAAWKKSSLLIPTDVRRCTPNPISFQCDEGHGILERLSDIQIKMKDQGMLAQWIDLYSKYYSYKVEHEKAKLIEFVNQYEAAVRPNGVVQEFIVNTLRGNNKRTDGKVYANCVGPREELQGKCDLVFKHQLLTRVLNQAIECERLSQNSDRSQFSQVIVQYLSELKAMVDAQPAIKSELFPTYQSMNFDEVISDYQRKIN